MKIRGTRKVHILAFLTIPYRALQSDPCLVSCRNSMLLPLLKEFQLFEPSEDNVDRLRCGFARIILSGRQHHDKGLAVGSDVISPGTVIHTSFDRVLSTSSIS